MVTAPDLRIAAAAAAIRRRFSGRRPVAAEPPSCQQPWPTRARPLVLALIAALLIPLLGAAPLQALPLAASGSERLTPLAVARPAEAPPSEAVSAQVASAAASDTAAADPATLAAGARLFEAHCVGCHLGGGNVIRRGRTLRLPALERAGLASPEAIARIAADGLGQMSGYGSVLGEEGTAQVAAWVWQQALAGWPRPARDAAQQ